MDDWNRRRIIYYKLTILAAQFEIYGLLLDLFTGHFFNLGERCAVGLPDKDWFVFVGFVVVLPSSTTSSHFISLFIKL